MTFYKKYHLFQCWYLQSGQTIRYAQSLAGNLSGYSPLACAGHPQEHVQVKSEVFPIWRTVLQAQVCFLDV